MSTFGNRVRETTDTTGTGTLDLNGTVTGFRAFATEFTDGDDEIPYLIVDDPTNITQYEQGYGQFHAGTPGTFDRDTVVASSNSDNKVSWSAGTKTIICTPTAEDFNAIFAAGGWGTKSAKVRSITASDSQVAADDGKLITADASGNSPAALTFTCLAEATAGDGFTQWVLNAGGSGSVVVNDDAAAELTTLAAGEFAQLRCNGTSWTVLKANVAASGTWTPAFTFSTPGDLSVAYSAQAGAYVRRGIMVSVNFQITTSTFTHSSASGVARLTGLPFPVKALGTGKNWLSGLARWQGVTLTGYTQLGILAVQGQSYLQFTLSGSATAVGDLGSTQMPTGGTVILAGTIEYEIDV